LPRWKVSQGHGTGTARPGGPNNSFCKKRKTGPERRSNHSPGQDVLFKSKRRKSGCARQEAEKVPPRGGKKNSITGVMNPYRSVSTHNKLKPNGQKRRKLGVNGQNRGRQRTGTPAEPKKETSKGAGGRQATMQPQTNYVGRKRGGKGKNGRV